MEKPLWLKSKGYLHITAQIDVEKRKNELIKKVTNEQYISKYAFYPLIHSTIDERRYKRLNPENKLRAHSYKVSEGVFKKNIKSRPLHYASHLDSIIFGYYAEILQKYYEEEISKFDGLHECITAYRKIPLVDGLTNKSTIHFANEIFIEIKRRAALNEECAVLTFDVKGFFSSLDHDLLKQIWANLLKKTRLPDDHFNVFKASTNFCYILKDDLRIRQTKYGKKAPFNEKELARIRNKKGIHAYFESPEAFRNKIKNGELKIHKYPFRNKEGKPIGIPQGLPLSAVLANIYLLEFDKKILTEITSKMGAYYRRYSDDIVILGNVKDIKKIDEAINSFIADVNLEISKDKTEIFIFKNQTLGSKKPRLTSMKFSKNGTLSTHSFHYLGFEFNGNNVLLKSSNVSKFYRRMIMAVKRKAKRALKNNINISSNPVVYKRQLYRLFTQMPLTKIKSHIRWKKLVKTNSGEFRLKTGKKDKIMRSNYLSYVKRASTIINEPMIEGQLRKHRLLLNQAIKRHLKL